MVPHLTTALTGPLLELERRFLNAATRKSNAGFGASGRSTRHHSMARLICATPVSSWHRLT